jgi:hypothetical protein
LEASRFDRYVAKASSLFAFVLSIAITILYPGVGMRIEVSRGESKGLHMGETGRESPRNNKTRD